MGRGAWWATVHGVEKNRTRLKQWSTHASQFPGQDLGTAGLGASGSRPSQGYSIAQEVRIWAQLGWVLWFKVSTRLQHCSGGQDLGTAGLGAPGSRSPQVAALLSAGHLKAQLGWW